MRLLIYIFFAIGLVNFYGCRSEVEPLFEMNMDADFDIPAGLSGILTHTFIIEDVINPLIAYTQNTGIDTSQIRSIQAGRGEITAIFNSTNYDFVDRVSVWVVDPNNVERRKEIYYLDFNNNQNNDNSLRLLSASSNVKDILTDNTFNMEVKLTFRRISPQLIENRLIFSLLALE